MLGRDRDSPLEAFPRCQHGIRRVVGQIGVVTITTLRRPVVRFSSVTPANVGTVRCPNCSVTTSEEMPSDCCVYFWECPHCLQVIRPKPGDCCVFCSYGSVPCPPKRAE